MKHMSVGVYNIG